jgi:DNA-binding XRE family transcriptional regulator
MHIGSNASENFDFLRARHFRAARVLLDWTQDELARKACVVRRTIVMLESGGCRTQPRKVEAVLTALGAAGIRFACNGDGEVSLVDGSARLDRVHPRARRDADKDGKLRTRVSGRRPVAV